LSFKSLHIAREPTLIEALWLSVIFIASTAFESISAFSSNTDTSVPLGGKSSAVTIKSLDANFSLNFYGFTYSYYIF
jgi:hypothetical protein